MIARSVASVQRHNALRNTRIMVICNFRLEAEQWLMMIQATNNRLTGWMS